MRKAWMSALILVIGLQTLGSASEPPVIQEEPAQPVQFNTQAICAPSWYVAAEGIFYTRDRADRRAISADVDFTGTPTVLMSTDALEFDCQPGLRITLGRQFGDNALELSYFGIDQYDATAEVTAASAPSGSLQSALVGFDVFVTAPPFDGADLHRISYDSNLHNAEFNFRHRQPGSESVDASWLVGARYMKVHERFDFQSTVNDWMGGGLATGVLGAVTENDMIGLQLGGDLLWHATQRLGLQAGAKGALLGNSAVQRRYIIYDMPAPGANMRDDASAADHRLSSVVEASLSGIYQVTPRVRFRAGYQVLVVGGLALAPTQLNFGDDPDSLSDVKHQGTTVFHGPSCGLDVTW